MPLAALRGGFRSCNIGADSEGRGGAPSRLSPNSCGRKLLARMYQQPSSYVSFDSSYLSLADQERYRFALYAHGHSHWASRLKMHLIGGRLLLKQVGLCEEYYGVQLKAGVHYLAIDYNWKNLSAVIDWARDASKPTRDAEVRAIVLRMNRYADSIIGNLRTIDEMARRLVMGYRSLVTDARFVFPPGQPLDDIAPETIAEYG